MLDPIDLSLEDRERLAELIEECGEIIQAATKTLKHGWESTYDNGVTNRTQLAMEIGDLSWHTQDLANNGLIDGGIVRLTYDSRHARVSKYRHYAKSDY
jgi:NTP pyrophosphatase (non-canonical NTP hydrolase)